MVALRAKSRKCMIILPNMVLGGAETARKDIPDFVPQNYSDFNSVYFLGRFHRFPDTKGSLAFI